ncbi:MAG: hypothetical protein ACFCAD_26540 [Pleurocapsa sp.]
MSKIPDFEPKTFKVVNKRVRVHNLPKIPIFLFQYLLLASVRSGYLADYCPG